MGHSFSSPPPPELPALETPARKHARTDGDDNSETEDFTTSVPATPMPHTNILTFARRYAVEKNLKPAQMQEVLDFVKRPLDERFLMLFVACIQSRDNEASLARALASWVPSSTTETNIQTYSRLVMLSPKLKGYKDSVAEKYLWTITRNLRWDIPDAVFSNPAATGKLTERIRYHLTQNRSTLKKKIAASLVGKTKDEHQHIFTLAQAVVANTSMTVSIQLCARLALLRAEYIDFPGSTFYSKVDARLSTIRTNFRDNPSKITRFFHEVLNVDVASHGHSNLDIEILASETQPSETKLEVEKTIDNANDAGVPFAEIRATMATLTSGVALANMSVVGASAGDDTTGGAGTSGLA
ncbi:uncharacterized protein LACBIDRAFT_304934 [Laccaria bicolor S238N-H82]|uniref:Predicted protein n=1 Tax=Laccaria bicolor (strain S238N-H82 / ATCC MYA-4686) TaxID=486041 RepID=B0DMP2_LACBS|nr:uncharacterized protein LACBIDRAFT_304934 [Laccaria bicolor S238N-H82]EDR04322.1 predicted protein [Laccaria bicolor S238N-H82]|eukprot:XP_001885213.1 predicted protein [Laccaria bicolor S238N-H82]